MASGKIRALDLDINIWQAQKKYENEKRLWFLFNTNRFLSLVQAWEHTSEEGT